MGRKLKLYLVMVIAVSETEPLKKPVFAMCLEAIDSTSIMASRNYELKLLGWMFANLNQEEPRR